MSLLFIENMKQIQILLKIEKTTHNMYKKNSKFVIKHKYQQIAF